MERPQPTIYDVQIAFYRANRKELNLDRENEDEQKKTYIDFLFQLCVFGFHLS